MKKFSILQINGILAFFTLIQSFSVSVSAQSSCSPYAEIARAYFQSESVIQFLQWKNDLTLTNAQINTQNCNERKQQLSLEKYQKLQESIASGYPILFIVSKENIPGGSICLFDFLLLNELKSEEVEFVQDAKSSCGASDGIVQVRLVSKDLRIYMPNHILDLISVRQPSSTIKTKIKKSKTRNKDAKK